MVSVECEKLKDAGELIRSAFDDERAVQFINEKRVDSIVTSTEDDVKKNTAEDYLNR